MRFSSLLLLATLSAACGGAQSQVSVAPSSPLAHVAGIRAPNGTEAAASPEVVKAPMKPIAPTAMAADLRALDLDPSALPALDQLPPGKLRGVMKTFAKALGARCSDCHIETDFAAATPRKEIAAGMWTDFIRQLAFKDGTALYCDSCHHGTMTPLTTNP